MPDTADGGTETARQIAQAITRAMRETATDPTKLTTDAVNQATDQWRRELAAAVEVIRTRLTAMDRATTINGERIAEIEPATDAQRAHLRHDIDRQVLALRELLGARLDAMDKANDLLAENVRQFPSDLDKATKATREILAADIRNVEAVAAEKFTAIEGTFASNALALTAALAAQKEAAAEQNKSNTLAITKSEQATKETIAANAAQTTAGLASLQTTIDDIKQRVVRIESGGVASAVFAAGKRQDETFGQADRIAAQAAQRATVSLVIGAVSALVGIIAIIVVIAFH